MYKIAFYYLIKCTWWFGNLNGEKQNMICVWLVQAPTISTQSPINSTPVFGGIVVSRFHCLFLFPCVSAFPCFFASLLFASLLLRFSAFLMLLCFAAFLPLCFSAFLPLRFWVFLPLCFFAFLPFCFSASLPLPFPCFSLLKHEETSRNTRLFISPNQPQINLQP